MADSSDVENALVSMLSAALYPNGTGSPSLVGSGVSIHRGWPTEAEIANCVTLGDSWVAVHGDKAMSKDATRYLPTWQGTPGIPTVTITVSGFTVTFTGTVSVGHSLAVQSQGLWYIYATQSGDTLTAIATAFAALIPGATSSGSVLTLLAGQIITISGTTPLTTDTGALFTTANGGQNVQARVAMIGSASIEASRAQQAFRICIWSPTPAIRDAVFGQIPGIVGYLGSRLVMPDGSTATRMAQRQAGPDDMPAKANMWRRDLLVTYDFAVNYQTVAGTVIVISQTSDINGATVKQQGGDVLNSAQASIL